MENPNHKVTRAMTLRQWKHGDSRLKLAEADYVHSWKAKRRTLKKKNASGQRGYNKLINVPMFVAVIMKENQNPMTRESKDYAATSALIQNFSLLAWEQESG